MVTACGCPPDAGLSGPQHSFHAPEVCQGTWSPLWSCELEGGRVDVYDSCVAAIGSDEMIANPWGLLRGAWSVADREWSFAGGVAAYRAKMAIDCARDLDYVRTGQVFIVRLEEVPWVSLTALLVGYRKLINEKESR